MSLFYAGLSNIILVFSSPFYLFLLLAIINLCVIKKYSYTTKCIIIIVFTLAFLGLYSFFSQNTYTANWINRLNNPIFLALSFIAAPSIFLRKGKLYNVFRIFVLAIIIAAVWEVFNQYSLSKSATGFRWFLIRPVFFIPALIGIIVMAKDYLSLRRFRAFTRVTMLLALLFGGFAFRQNSEDYQSMLERRQNYRKNVLNLSETTPVLKYDNSLSYIPSAPCRFSADGGYVQGCVMELLQRIAQVNFIKVFNADPSETSTLAIALAALLCVTIMCFIGARWWCGWICPLTTLGDTLDFIRRKMGFTYLKPSKRVKITALLSGISFGSFGLILAKAYPHLNSEGKFMGCKIPVYPFCKICPGQQICPSASFTAGASISLPGTEWLFGFFKISVVLLLGLFIIGYFSSRRLWCRFCPMGMIGGIFNKGGMLAIKKDARKCNGCGICNEVCPMDIHIVENELKKEDVSSFDCVYCGKCVDNCPQDKCVKIEFAGKTIIESNFTEKIKNEKSI